ncbi:MAG TPA: glycosyltransferase family 4 protein [Candidatus Binatia bacterium]|nr:glycosyltransferase family 4 protein [Candidatus Binatia bacterium]
MEARGTPADLTSPAELQFHILSFEGPDGYARAGGISSRITGLSKALADAGFETHLWFIGDPDLPGHENHGRLWLHRWCQWISKYHPGGVYDGEEGKHADYSRSLPPFLSREILLPHLRRGGRAVVLAEEWQTVDTVLHLDWLLRGAKRRPQTTIFWNANNTFSFDRIDWAQLDAAAVITTVSRYMKQILWTCGVNPLVIPNGLTAEAFLPPPRDALAEFRTRVRNRTLLTKVARWDPDKRWLLAVETVRMLKKLGWRPLLLARGGSEAHGSEVLAQAAASGLRVLRHSSRTQGVDGLLDALEGIDEADIVDLRTPLGPESCRLLFRGSSAVLANSGREPFGLVGLETMAAGGVACTGATGEDYAVPGQNALVLETSDPWEFVTLFQELRANPLKDRALRRAGRATAEQYSWAHIVRRLLLPRLHMVADQVRTGKIMTA